MFISEFLIYLHHSFSLLIYPIQERGRNRGRVTLWTSHGDGDLPPLRSNKANIRQLGYSAGSIDTIRVSPFPANLDCHGIVRSGVLNHII